MNKRGQFYIIAAIIIVIAIAAITSIRTYTVTKSKPETITDLGKMLNLEGAKVVDYGIYNAGKPFKEGNPVTVQNVLDDFQTSYLKPYFEEKLKGAEIILVYSDPSNPNNPVSISSIKSTSTGTIEISGTETSGEERMDLQPLSTEAYRVSNIPGSNRKKIDLTLLDDPYSIELGPNEIFYFAIAQEQGGERYVEKKDQPSTE